MGTRMPMDKAEQLAEFRDVISYYERKIEEYLMKKDFSIARNWYSELCGAQFLAKQLGLLVDPQDAYDRECKWFQRIQDAQFGQSGGNLG